MLNGKNPDEGAFIAYLFHPEAFMVGTLDDKSSKSGVIPSNALQWISSETMPAPKGDSNTFADLPDAVSEGFLSELTERCFSLVKAGEVEVPAGVFEECYRRHLGKIDPTDLPKGLTVIRSSKDWTISEMEAQRERLRSVLAEQLARGFVPSRLVADADSGSNMIRPGLMSAIAVARTDGVQGVFMHTIERFTRSEVDGLLMLILCHWLTGNVFYRSMKFDIYVEFDSTSRQSVLLAAEEVMEGARESGRIRERMTRGKRGVLLRGKKYTATIAMRLFHRGRRRAA